MSRAFDGEEGFRRVGEVEQFAAKTVGDDRVRGSVDDQQRRMDVAEPAKRIAVEPEFEEA